MAHPNRVILRTCLVAPLAFALTLVAGGPPAKADEAGSTMVEARRQFQAGVNLLDDPDGARYEEAYLAFHKAYELSRSPKVLGNIGFCSLKLERDGEAIDSYTAYLRESRDIDPRERAQIERDLATLGSTVGTLRVVVPNTPGTIVLIDTRIQTRGAQVVNSYPFEGGETTLRLRPGRHALKVKAGERESLVSDVVIEPGSRTSREFGFQPVAPADAPASPTPEATRASPSYAGPVILGLLGVAALGTGTVTGLLARSKADDIGARCPDDVCPRGYDLASARAEAKTFGTIADGTFLGGGVALGAAVVWALLIPSRPQTARPTTAQLAPAAACGPRGCGLEIGGSF